ncbi:MAG TPA: hypothetical protein VF043_05680 [Ktedonobacteraceae bacterium]
MPKSTISVEEQFTDQALPGRTQFLSVPVLVRNLPFIILLMMTGTWILLDAILPLKGLNSGDALLAHVSTWTLLPSNLLFPGWAIRLALPRTPILHPPAATLSWQETAFLLNAFLLMFLIYWLALYALPRLINRKYLLYSTLLLGFVCVFIPVVTSSDIFSYIAYARMEVIYHLNPLTTLPTAIHGDFIYPYLYWRDQPSAYGPTWAIITGLAQWLIGVTGLEGILRMVFALRLLGLASHVSSTMLIWSISGQLQRITGVISPRKRMLAALAFAWNPLLLFEACVNSHNDAILLFLILLALWFLLRRGDPGGRPELKHDRPELEHDRPPQLTLRSLLPAAIVFAIATCLKINIVVFVPGLLIFLWMQRSRNVFHILVTSATYLGVIILLYAPFWQQGAVLHLLSINPSTSRAINTPYDFLSQFYNTLAHVRIYLNAPGEPIATPMERLTHIFSAALFVLIYAILCWRAARISSRINTIPGLIRWMALVWLLYCVIGSPWFWPWYLVTFFGLYALVESTTKWKNAGIIRIPLIVRLLAFSMLSLYCLSAWAPAHISLPGLQGFVWGDLRGLWVWAIPLLAIFWAPLSLLAKLPQLCKGLVLQKVKAPVLRG